MAGEDVEVRRWLREWFADAPSEDDLRRYEERLVRIGRGRPIPGDELREIARRYIVELAGREFEREQFEQVLRDPELPTLLWDVYCPASLAGAQKRPAATRGDQTTPWDRTP